MSAEPHDERLVSPQPASEDRAIGTLLRPKDFKEYVGQKKVVDNLKVFVEAATKRGEALDHVLLAGPPGLGKTTLAQIIAREMAVRIREAHGPALEKKGDLAGDLLSGATSRLNLTPESLAALLGNDE